MVQYETRNFKVLSVYPDKEEEFNKFTIAKDCSCIRIINNAGNASLIETNYEVLVAIRDMINEIINQKK